MRLRKLAGIDADRPVRQAGRSVLSPCPLPPLPATAILYIAHTATFMCLGVTEPSATKCLGAPEPSPERRCQPRRHTPPPASPRLTGAAAAQQPIPLSVSYICLISACLSRTCPIPLPQMTCFMTSPPRCLGFLSKQAVAGGAVVVKKEFNWDFFETVFVVCQTHDRFLKPCTSCTLPPSPCLLNELLCQKCWAVRIGSHRCNHTHGMVA